MMVDLWRVIQLTWITRFILVLNEEAAVFVCFFSAAHPFRLSPFQTYFIFDLTGAPCQCTVLINRVGSPEKPSLSPILFQQSRSSVQSWREVLRLERSLEVSLCVWRSSNQQMQNTASIQASRCAHECISTSAESSMLSFSHTHAFKKAKGQNHMFCTYTHAERIKLPQTCTHTVIYSHTCTQTLQPFEH